MVPPQWVYVISKSTINKHFTVVHIKQPTLQNLGVVEKTIKWDQDLKITPVSWLRFSPDHPAAVHVRSRLGGVVVSVLAAGPKVCGFEPGQGDGFLSVIRILSTPSFRMGSKAGGPMS
jgi:hypothetical protein